MNVIVCLAGGVASGKTSVAQALVQRLGSRAEVRSFGDVVRRQAEVDHVSPNRVNLQALGLQMIRKGWPAFVDQLIIDLDPSLDVLIVDGIRHVEPIEEVRRRWPEVSVLVVFLHADEEVLEHRLEARGEVAGVRYHETESHSAELATCADLILNTGSTSDVNAVRIVEMLDQRPLG